MGSTSGVVRVGVEGVDELADELRRCAGRARTGTGPRRRRRGGCAAAGVWSMPGIASSPSMPPTDSRPVVVTSRTSGAAATIDSDRQLGVVDDAHLGAEVGAAGGVDDGVDAAALAEHELHVRRRAGTGRAPSGGPTRRRRRRPRGSAVGELGARAWRRAPRRARARRARRRRRGSSRAGAVERRLLRRASTTRTPADAQLVEHLGRAGEVVGEDDGRLERQDRLGDERALVADLRRRLGLRRVRRRDVGGHDLVAEPEGVDDLGEVAVDRDDPLGRRRRRRVVAVPRRPAPSAPPPSPRSVAARPPSSSSPPHAGEPPASGERRARRRRLTTARAALHELDDEPADVLGRRGAGSENAEAHDRQRRRRRGRRTRTRSGRRGASSPHVDRPCRAPARTGGRRRRRGRRSCGRRSRGDGGGPGRPRRRGRRRRRSSPSPRTRRPSGWPARAAGSTRSRRSRRSRRRPGRGPRRSRPPRPGRPSATGAASPTSVTRPTASGSRPVDVALGDEQAGPRVGGEVAGVLGELRDHEQRVAGVVEAVGDDGAERVAGGVEGDRRERARSSRRRRACGRRRPPWPAAARVRRRGRCAADHRGTGGRRARPAPVPSRGHGGLSRRCKVLLTTARSGVPASAPASARLLGVTSSVSSPRGGAASGPTEVDRLLPFHARRMVGPFIFADLMGPEDLAPGHGADVRRTRTSGWPP